MEHITSFEKRIGADLGYHSSSIDPNHEGRVGRHGFDKSLRLDQILKIAYELEQKPNIIIKAGPNAKWYLKNCEIQNIDEQINIQQRWRDTSRCTMWIIVWDI